MAATLTLAPPALAHSKSPIFVELTTSLWNGAGGAHFLVEFFFSGAGGPSAGQQIVFSWEGKTVTMTAAATPDASGNQFPAFSGQPQNDYVLAVEEAFRKNALLDDDFDFISLFGAYSVELHFRRGGTVDLTISGSITDGRLEATDSAGAFSESNLSATLRLYAADSKLIEPLQLAYNPKTGKAEADLSGLFDGLVGPHLPEATTILPAVGPLPSGVAFRAMQAFFLRFADRFGNPAAVQAMTKSPNFHVIYGALAADHDGGFNYSGIFMCHRYRKKDGTSMVKTVAPDQPDWVFVGSTVAEDFYIDYLLTWSDGTQTTYLPVGGAAASVTIAANQLKWVPSGFAQSKLGSVTPPTAGLEIVAYRWRLLKENPKGALAAFVDYELACDCADWGLFLALDNGIGGIETVHLAGKSSRKYEVERDEFRRTRWRDWSLADGDSGQFGAEGRHVIEVSTGWIEREWCEHLRQLLLGRLWLVDIERERFEAVTLDTKSLTVAEDDGDLFELTFTLRAAWADASFNTF